MSKYVSFDAAPMATIYVGFGENVDHGVDACLEVGHWPQPLTLHV